MLNSLEVILLVPWFFSVGFACWAAIAEGGVRSVLSAPFPRNKKNPVNFWMSFCPALSKGLEGLGSSMIRGSFPYVFLRACKWGILFSLFHLMLKFIQSFLNIFWHGYMDFSSLIIPSHV